MLPLRLLLILLLAAIGGYTAVVVTNHGLNFLPVFVGDIARFGWPGQFNLDFLGLLLLAGLWLAWRHRFGAAGLALGVAVLVGGTPLLCVYLLVQLARCEGDLRRVLVGPRG